LDGGIRITIFFTGLNGRLIEHYWNGDGWFWNDHKWMPSSDAFGYRLASSPVAAS